MKFQPDHLAGTNAITRVDDAAVWVGATRHDGSLVVPWRGDVRGWAPAGFDALAEADFAALLALSPEVVLFGSGARLRFAPPALIAPLIARRVGVETMDTRAACRTFNVLAAEGRSVVAALLAAHV